MPRASSADSYGPASCRADREYRHTSLGHVDRSRNNVYVAVYKSSSRSPPYGSGIGLSHHTAAPRGGGGLDEYQRRAQDRRPLADLLELKGPFWAAARDG